MKNIFTAVVQPDATPSGSRGYFAHCPELDIASQGDTAEEARENLKEALELFFEDATPKKSNVASNKALKSHKWNLQHSSAIGLDSYPFL